MMPEVASRRMRLGLLGSTALIAASLAASGAMAQTTVATPAGGGTITRTGGSSSTTDQTAGGGGVLISNVTQAALITVNGVSINNTTGAPSGDALRILGETSTLNSTGVAVTGVNTLTTTVNGGAALYIQTGANMGASINSSGSTFTGSYGINLQAPSGYVSFDASNQSQSFVASGTHIAGFNAVTGVNASIRLGSSTITGFDTGINTSNFFGSFVEMTGGSINALVTGIRTDATGGSSNIQSQAAIVAPTGIHSTNTTGAQITTSGAGTINSTSNGVGTGIIATSSGGTNLDTFSINVGAAIGNSTAFATGVDLSTTGTSTNSINLTTTAAITATGRAISATAGTFGNAGTFNLGANVTGATGVYTNVGNYAVNIGAGVTVTSTGNGSSNAALYLINGTNTVTNNGTLTASGTGSHGVHFSSNGLVTNTATGTITGSTGIYYQNLASVTNAGRITGTGAANTAGVYGSSGASVTNTGTITGYDGVYSGGNPTTHNNSGTITGVAHGYNLDGGRITLTNSGAINTAGGTGGAGLSGLRLNTTNSPNIITNSGTITGGGDATYGYGVEIANGAVTLTNSSGGVITGGIGGIWLANDDLATINLNLGSTVTGQILSTSTGARTTTVAGLLDGAYNAAGGSGIDTITLASTGSITGAVTLGAGDDVFTWQGGTFTTINAGTGTADVFNSALGVGVSNTLDMATLSLFEAYNHQSGILTLTGNNNGAYGWVGSSGTTINLSGTIDGISNSSYAISMFNNPGSTVNILAGGVIGGSQSGVQFNGPAIGTMTNSGSIVVDGTAVASVSGRVNLTNNVGGSITSSLFAGVFLATGGGTIINDGTITGGSDATNGYGIRSLNTASGGNNAAITNSATKLITGGQGGVSMAGAGTMTITNAGTVSGTVAGSSGVMQSAGTLTVTNNSGGLLTGNGYAVNTTGGSLVLTNASGATLSGGSVGAIQAATSGTATIDLQAGSTTTGDMILSGTGARTVTVAGGFSGNLNASGNSGAVNLNLNTSATGYTLLTGGSGADTLTFTGSGSRTFSVDNLTSWDTGAFTGGAWTLTGTGNATSFVSGLSVTGGSAVTISNTQQLQGATALTLNAGALNTTASLSNTRTINLTGAGGLGVASGQTLTQSGVVSGAGVLTLTGPGTLVLSGNNTYTGGTVVNTGILRLSHTSAAGTGVIRLIDPQIDFAATGTYNNDISLEVVNGQQAADPTILNNTSGGAISLAGRIYETSGVGGAGQYVTFNGGSITVTNGLNSWAGVTRINSGATLLGTTASISGASIVNNGTLTYQNASAGTATQNISGSGAININGTAATTLSGAITTTGQLTIGGAGAQLILGGSRSGASNTGAVISGAGASLTVADGASLQAGQYNGVRVTSGGVGATITNLGLIQNAGTGGDGTVGAGIYVLNGGAGGTTTVNNGSITDTGAGSTIQGRNAGVRHESGSTDLLVINNYGLIVGDLYNGVENTGGGLTVNNFSGGYITATLGNGVSSASGSAVSVTNAGVIGRNIAGNFTVNGYGVTTNGVLTLNNQSGGLITGTMGGIQSNAAGSSTTNQAGGTILGNYGVVTAGGTLTNSGLIRGFNDAVLLNGATAVTNNAGGLIVGAGNEGVFVNANGSTINNAGLIVNSLSGIGANFSVAITNSGVIASGAAPDAATTSAQITRLTGTAIALGAGGSVTNAAGGEILGGVGVSFNNGASGTLTNAGLIDGSTGYGVQMSGAGTISNQSGGTITGVTGSIQLTGAGAKIVNMQAGSTANGQIVSTATGTQTVNIAGSLNGAYTVTTGSGVDNLTLAATGAMTSAYLGDGSDSFTYQGGSFSGLIDAGSAGTDSFISNLSGGSSSVNLSNLANFETFAHQSGTLTLTGTGAFSGGASITGGSLVVNGSLQSAASIASGATLRGGGTITGAVSIANGGILANTQGSTLTMGSLGLLSGSIINATFSGTGGPALFAVSGDLTLDGTVNVASTGAYGFGVYGLMTYGGVLTDNGLIIGTTPSGAQRVVVQTSVAGQVNIVHAPTELLFWDGGNAGQHDNGAVNGGSGVWTAAGSEWTDANGLFNGAMEPQPGFAIFQGVGGVVTVDNSLGSVGVTGMQFAADGYRIQGGSITLANASTTIRVGDGTAPSAAWTATIASALTGTGGLLKTDLGTLILAGDNTYTGGSTINAGTLQIGDGASAGSIVGPVVNNAALIFARGDNYDFASAVSGSGSVSINGVVKLSGAITSSQGVTILNGSSLTSTGVITAPNAITFANGGTFANAGTVNGDVAKNGANASTVTNTGSINGTVYNVGSGLLTIANRAGGLIRGASTGISGGGVMSITNAGTISGVNGSSNGIAASGTLTLVNQNGGQITGGSAGSAVLSTGANASITNQNGGRLNGFYGISTSGAGGVINNSGLIRGVNDAILLNGATTLTNNAGGLVVGGGNEGVFVNATGSTINNAGLIINALNGITANTYIGAITNSGIIANGTA